MEIKLFKGKYEEVDLGQGNHINYTIRTVGMYLVVESVIGMAVMWDRKTSVRILLEPQHSVSSILSYMICGVLMKEYHALKVTSKHRCEY